MSSVFHGAITVSIFGQSHAPGIGVVVDGLPAGEKIDLDELQAFLTRRAPGTGSWSTPRKEADAPEILSGLADGVTCGGPFGRRHSEYQHPLEGLLPTCGTSPGPATRTSPPN